MKYNYVKYNLNEGAHKYFDRRILLTAAGTLAVAIVFTFGIFSSPTNHETNPTEKGTSQSGNNGSGSSDSRNGNDGSNSNSSRELK